MDKNMGEAVRVGTSGILQRRGGSRGPPFTYLIPIIYPSQSMIEFLSNCANYPEYLFFLLVWPPRFQSLLIMGWCDSIPEHRL